MLAQDAVVQIRDEIKRLLHIEAQIDEQLAHTLTGQSSPVVCVSPVVETQVAALLHLAFDRQWTVMPLGSKTQFQMGQAGEKIDIVLSLSHLNQVIEYSPADLTIRVQAGVTLEQLQQIVNAKRQMLPLDPACDPKATIGGLVATNASGPLRALYGSLRDFTIGLTVVYPDGQVIRTGGNVVKNVAGYDMTKLFIGSLGTLAVITQVVFKLKPLPPRSDLSLLSGTFLAMKELLNTLRESEAVFSRCEWISGGSFTEGAQWLLALGCDEPMAASDVQAEFLESLAKSYGLTFMRLVNAAADEFWHQYRQQLGEISTAIRISSPPEQMPKLADELKVRFAQEGLVALSMTVPAGVGHLYLELRTSTQIAQIIQQCRDLVHAVGGTAVLLKTTVHDAEIDTFGPVAVEVQRLCNQVKEIVDTRRILSPGRFIGGI
ncbi:FAD-binding oxidoreductase [Sulfoacidibacillus thermotolerans]|uniref:FAD-binding PCMH-type domain-containing protein n=1 Tax=Sulfoacidibacillus thermotolerans TaxID=1765684 RepID=A0A2U3D942_SULT2|nr:FAD-binding oxidoreductase [Sulfoacidibacillus thermotolerans]PWI57800.1 hypothetical protein BM613_06295 [Sulfoacidibacillus thermotolerans]